MTVPVPADAADRTPLASHSRPGWWRTNRLALISLIVLVPLVSVGMLWNEAYAWFGYGVRKVTAVQVPADGTVVLDGATWGPIHSGVVVDTTGLDIPEGTHMLAAIIPVEPHGEAVQCNPPTLIQQSTGREWTQVRYEIGMPYSSDEPSKCIADLADEDDPTSARPYAITVGFVVPDDVDGPFWVDVDPLGDATFVRFSIDP